MSGKNRMKKRRNRICRRIAVALTVALLVGQSQALVLAEEGEEDLRLQTEVSSEESGTDISGNGGATDSGNAGNTGSDLGQNGNNGGTGSQGQEDSLPEDDKDDGDQPGDDNTCICGTKCTEDAVNTDCPVCAENYEACAGKADDEGNDDPGNNNTGDNDAENDNTGNNGTENGGQDNTDGSPEENTKEPDVCVCVTPCTEDAINADCPVCAANYANCAQNAGGGGKTFCKNGCAGGFRGRGI